MTRILNHVIVGEVTARSSMPSPRRRARGRVRGRVAVLSVAAFAFVFAVMGCVGEKGVAPSVRAPDIAIGSITVSPLNIVMAMGDTLSINVTGRTLTGAPLASFDSVQYLLQNTVDTLRTRVSASGLVTAVGISDAGNPVRVQVVAFKDGFARADLVFITVVATAFPSATLSIQPVPPDSATLAAGEFKFIVPQIGNTVGESVDFPMVRFEYSANDSSSLACFSPYFVATATLTAAQLQAAGTCSSDAYGQPDLDLIFARLPGTAWVHANVTVFGVPLRDSVQYTLTNAMSGTVVLQPLNLALGFQQGLNVPIAPGGTVTFQNGFGPDFGASIQFVFDNPSAATAPAHPPSAGGTTGNITPLTSRQSTQRRFLTPGVYTWTATVIGGIPPYAGATTHGTVTVQ